MISVQNAPEAPAPTGLAAALEVLRTPEIFRNMSLGAETVAAVQALATQAIQASHESQMQAAELAAQLAAAAAGIPLPTGTGGRGGTSGGSGATRPSSSDGRGTGAAGAAAALSGLNRSVNAAAGEAVRNSSPARVYDQLQNIERARQSGLLTEDDANTAVQNLLGAPSGDIGDILGGLFGAGSPRPTATGSTKADALNLVPLLRQITSSRWKLKPNDVADRLEVLIKDPDKIQQGALNLCGPAAFFNVWMQRDPAAFAGYTYLLYKNVRGYIGSFKVEPDDDLVNQDYYNGVVPSLQAKAIRDNVLPQLYDCPSTDWMTMGALRDVENLLFDFEGTPEENVAAATTPGDLADWLESTHLYERVRDEANWFFTKGLNHAMSLEYDLTKRDILMLVNSHIFTKAGQVKGLKKSDEFILNSFPNHIIVLRSPVTESPNDANKVTFSCWTWGDVTQLEMNKDVFAANYYGAVIAEL